MSTSCVICLEPATAPAHPKCTVRLFGSPLMPALDLETAQLHTIALAQTGRTSLSGVQRKLSLHLTADRKTLSGEPGGGRYILKPDSQIFPELPANEHTTMRVAALFDIDIPECALMMLRDGTLAYVVERFDRPREGGKLAQEDFCQLAGKPSSEKYAGSAELCVKLVKRFAGEPLIEVLHLFRRLVFAWWSGNGDMHLKNFALLTGPDGRHRLSPAYDQLCTQIVIPEDQLALSVRGRKDGLKRRDWLAFAADVGLPARAVTPILDAFVTRESAACALVDRSFLLPPMKAAYLDRLRAHTAALAAV